MASSTWHVVGGAGNGILVRKGRQLSSPEVPGRLSKGALLRELELNGERLHYELVSGKGPATGWITIRAQGKDLVVKGGCVTPDEVKFGGLTKDPRIAGTEVWIICGDKQNAVHPYVALAVGLLKANFRVRLFAPQSYEALVRSVGVSFTAAGLTVEECRWQEIQEGEDPLFKQWSDSICHAASVIWPEYRRVKPPVFLYHPNHINLALCLFNEYGAPCLILSNSIIGYKEFNKGSFDYGYKIVDKLVEQITGIEALKYRPWEAMASFMFLPSQLCGLHAGEIWMFAGEDDILVDTLSKTLAQGMKGYWYLPKEVQSRLPTFGGPEALQALQKFISSGAAPVYMGWGQKVREEDVGVLLKIAVYALKATGSRGILLRGERVQLRLELLTDPALKRYAQENVLLVEAAPHDWLFEQCVCTVHHGGAGTTAAALRGAVPTIVTPFDDEQRRYGALVEKLEVGKCVPLTVTSPDDALVGALRAARDPKMVAAAKALGKTLKSELGVTMAVLGVKMYMDYSITSGTVKQEWEKYKIQVAKEIAFEKEMAEEGDDGVLRPKSLDLIFAETEEPQSNSMPAWMAALGGMEEEPPKPAKKAVKVPRSPPAWLRPDGKGKIMLLSSPLKGHVIHFKRVANWFRKKAPQCELHVCLMMDEPGFPDGVIKHLESTREGQSDRMERMCASAFMMAAGMDANPVKPGTDPGAEESEDNPLADINSFGKFGLETLISVMPDVVVAEGMFDFMPDYGIFPATCKYYKIFMVGITPMCIKENRSRSDRRVKKSVETRNERERRLASDACSFDFRALDSQEEEEHRCKDWQTISLPKGCRVIKAWYGDADIHDVAWGNKAGYDVTFKVWQLLSKSSTFRVEGGVMFGDPAPGLDKTLVIRLGTPPAAGEVEEPAPKEADNMSRQTSPIVTSEDPPPQSELPEATKVPKPDAAEPKPDAAEPKPDAAEPWVPTWKPDNMPTELLEWLGTGIKETMSAPRISLYPSPSFFHEEKMDLGEIFCAPFLPLPQIGTGRSVQQGRKELEGSIDSALLDWLFLEGNDDPIVYVAFGTIVSTFNSRYLVKRLVQALGAASWRVLFVLPESARDGLPNPEDRDPWRWTALGVTVIASRGESADCGYPEEMDAFTGEHLARFQRMSDGMGDYSSLEAHGLVQKLGVTAEDLTPDRWRVEKFVPQIHVLKCERVRCFVSHMGANSTLESMACGVPMLCTPFFMDQFDWAHTVRNNLRAGIQIDKIITDASAIRESITQVLTDPRYRQNAQAVARKISAQADILAEALGPAMAPDSNSGPGLSALGAMCITHMKGQDVRRIYEILEASV